MTAIAHNIILRRHRWLALSILATGLGVSPAALVEVFPNLHHFDTANLGFYPKSLCRE
jgi:hypothetical protein